MPHIALLTDSRYVAATAAADDWYHANILHDDALLQQALLRHNVSCTRVDWADPAVDWSAFDLAVFSHYLGLLRKIRGILRLAASYRKAPAAVQPARNHPLEYG